MKQFAKAGKSVLRNKGALTPALGGDFAARVGQTVAKAMKKGASLKNRGKKKKKSGDGVTAVGMPMAFGSILRNNFPHTARTGMCREFVADLGSTSTSGTFSLLLDLPLNPGNSRLFARTTAMADIYERYRFKSLRLCYEPSTAVVNSGVVAMYIDRDPVDAPVASMPALMANQMSVMGPIYEPLTLVLDPRDQSWYFTQQQTSDTSTALDRQQDPGDLRIACDKCAANLALGYVYVEYDIEFAYPKPPASIVFSSTVTAATTAVPNTSFLYGIPSSSTQLNRGFNLEDHVTGDDETPQNGPTFAYYDPVTSSAPSGLYNVYANLTVTVDSLAAFTASISYLPPGVTSGIINMASTSFTGTGSPQSVIITNANAVGGMSSVPSCPNGSRIFVQLYNASGSTHNAAIGSSSSFQISAVSNSNVGRSRSNRGLRFWEDEEKQARLVNAADSNPATIFNLPTQLDSALSFLSSLTGSSVLICPSASQLTATDTQQFAVRPRVTTLDEELDYRRLRRLDLSQIPPSPASDFELVSSRGRSGPLPPIR